ncbi:MAG: hypothetical protein IPJ34_13970 [Myxococcales bacterium]|nr:hypothetical protein [Myxococcales bacterium]
MKRRALLAGSLSLALVRLAKADGKKPTAGVLTLDQYLAVAAILFDETRRAQDWVGAHPSDVGLASVAWELADLRAQLAVRLVAPPAVKQAHMHLLLAMENTTASFDATMRGDAKKAAQRMAAARTEEITMQNALDAAKVKLPAVK